jgi:hypothetical protein
MSDNRETCFVIMPFSKTTDEHTEDYWTKHFVNFLKPLLEENPNLEAHRSEALRGDILRQIITSLVTAPIVVADLTDHNCNVFWELGIRQSFKHCTVTIAEFGTGLPFDVSGKATLKYYAKDYIKMLEFRSIFKQALNDCIENPSSPDSHVLETLGGRGTLFEIFRKDEAIRRLDAVISECTRNLTVLKAIRETAEKNRETPKKRWFPSDRLRASALELLVTNRYVDEDSSFFNLAERCLQDVLVTNDILNQWSIKPEAVERWILGTPEADSIKVHNQFIGKAAIAREKLGKMH